MAGTPRAAPRVLHLIKSGSGAGWVFRQVRELVGHGYDVHVAAPPTGPMPPRYAEVGAIWHPAELDFGPATPWRYPAAARTLRRLVERVRPDVIHSHFVGTTLVARRALGRHHPIPRIFQVAGPLHLEHAAFRKIELASAGRADYWVGSCRWTCDRYRASGVPEDRLWLSYLGTDVDEYRPQPPGKLRTELGLGPEAAIAGMVAYMYAPKRYLGQRRGIKGHEDFVDAVATVPGVTAVMIGGAWAGAGRYERRVRAYARRRLGERAVLLGTRDDVPDLYADIDVAVHPSHSENVGAASESLLLETPTIATHVGGFPDVVIPGETGWLVPPRRPDRIAAALREALADLPAARELAARGRAHVAGLLDVRDTAAEVAAIYEAVLARGRA